MGASRRPNDLERIGDCKLRERGTLKRERRRSKAYGKETRVLGDGGEENGGVSIEESSDARGANERRRVA